jgi:hypothetical protein
MLLSRRQRQGCRAFVVAAVALMFALTGVAFAVTSPPSNDDRANATDLGALPAAVSGTTAGATVEGTEPVSRCADAGASVWYRFTTGATPPRRLAVELSANGDLDAVADVYIRSRSQNIPVTCDATDNQGEAAFSFAPEAGTTYLVRVAQLSDSVSGTFRLQVFPLPPPANPPGAPLGPGGASGTLERVLNASAAYSSNLVAGVSYRVNLVSRIDGCMHLAIFAPGTGSFDDGSPVARLRCQGYRLFTPRESGRYSLLVEASGRPPDSQRYHLQLASATSADTAPGLLIRNDERVRDVLHGNRIDVLRLYHFDVTSRSDLELDLSTGSDNPFDLELLNSRGRVLECQCDSSGGESIVSETRPGRYFAVVQARDFSSGGFSLFRRSRSITNTTVRINGSRYVQAPPGASVAIQVRVAPAVDGPASIEIDRFDPLSGWQFYRQQRVTVSAGSATVPFVAPSTGQWLVHAMFLGSLTASASQSRYARVLFAGPLAQ